MKLFERVRGLCAYVGSQTEVAVTLGLPQNTFCGYLKESRENNLWPLLSSLLIAYPEISRDWLYFGEGEMLRRPADTAKPGAPAPLSLTPALPIVGVAACDFAGLQQIMPYPVTASPIALGPRAFAVLASGESMVPAGIASGHLCFCDPDQVAQPDEAVFFRQRDNRGALKVFLGRGEVAGFTRFKGWESARDERGHQKEAILDVRDEWIDCIAPVICIRRRG